MPTYRHAQIFEFADSVLQNKKILEIDADRTFLRDYVYGLERRFTTEAGYNRIGRDEGCILLKQVVKRKVYHILIVSYASRGTPLCSVNELQRIVRFESPPLPLDGLLDPIAVRVQPTPEPVATTNTPSMAVASDTIMLWLDEHLSTT